MSTSTDATRNSNEARPLTQQERVRLVQRVARSFSRLGPEGGQVTLKLHPAELGVLNVSIKIEGQSMTARLQTQTEAARDVILENLPVLRERLSDHGIEVEKFQVEVGQAEDLSNTGSNSNFNGQAGGAFSDSSQSSRNESTANNIDYRRASRPNIARPPVMAPVSGEARLSPWADRSLDLKV